jgi:hypothetical protein
MRQRRPSLRHERIAKSRMSDRDEGLRPLADALAEQRGDANSVGAGRPQLRYVLG